MFVLANSYYNNCRIFYCDRVAAPTIAEIVTIITDIVLRLAYNSAVPLGGLCPENKCNHWGKCYIYGHIRPTNTSTQQKKVVRSPKYSLGAWLPLGS